jgi:hypothetical protein
MLYDTQKYWGSGLCPSSGILENTTFRKIDLFPSSGEIREIPTLLVPLERARPAYEPIPYNNSITLNRTEMY